MNRRAFVFTGMAFLLVIPAMILATSYVNMVKYGEGARKIALESDKVYYITMDLKETIIDVAQSSGKYNAYLATKNVSETFENLTNEQGFDYAKLHSWFTDPEISPLSSCRVIEDSVMNSINDAIEDISSNYSAVISVNNGNNITDAVISINQTDPWGFYVNIMELPLLIQDGTSMYNTTIPEINEYISIEGFEDPYIFVNLRGNWSNRIYRTNSTPFNETYDENVDRVNGVVYQLYNALVGSGTINSPRPFYHTSNQSNDAGLSFFERLDGGNETTCSSNSSRMETFIIGDPLGDRASATRVDDGYFDNLNGDVITVCGKTFTDPLGNSFYIDDTHLNWYGLNRTYPCLGPDLTLDYLDITFSQVIIIQGDTVTITATIHNQGDQDASTVVVQFFDGDPDAGGTQIGSNKTIDSITAGGMDTVNVDWTADGGASSIYVRVDPANTIAESNENNNQASNSVCTATSLDITIVDPQNGTTTNNCPTTRPINVTIADDCGNPLKGDENATVNATFDSGDPNIDLYYSASTETYNGSWPPSNTGLVNISVTANGAGTWNSLSGTDDSFVNVDPCCDAGQNMLLFEDFDEGDSSNWTETNPQEWGIVGTIYRQDSNKNDRMSLAGNSSWTDYKYDLEWYPNDDDRIGLFFRYTDSSNWYRLEASTDEDYQGIRLYRNTGGGETMINESSWEYTQNVWYKFRIIGSGDQITTYIDKGSGYEELFNNTNGGGPLSGEIGLFTEEHLNADFDNVLVCG